MSPNRDERSQHSHERATHHSEKDHLSTEEYRLEEVFIDHPVCYPDEYEREQATRDSLHQPVDEEGKADEHVSRADQPHYRYLLGAGKNRHADGSADDDDRYRRERDSEGEAGDRGDCAQSVKLLDPFLAVTDVIDEVIGPDTISD